MKKNLPGILFLVAMPLSVVLYVRVESWTGSEFMGLLAAVLLYVAVGGLIAFFFGMSPLPPVDSAVMPLDHSRIPAKPNPTEALTEESGKEQQP